MWIEVTDVESNRKCMVNCDQLRQVDVAYENATETVLSFVDGNTLVVVESYNIVRNLILAARAYMTGH